MLYQLHWQFNDRTEMRAQTSFGPGKSIEKARDMKAWCDEVVDEHPLPEGAKWMMCNEKSKYFLWAVDDANILL